MQWSKDESEKEKREKLACVVGGWNSSDNLIGIGYDGLHEKLFVSAGPLNGLIYRYSQHIWNRRNAQQNQVFKFAA